MIWTYSDESYFYPENMSSILYLSVYMFCQIYHKSDYTILYNQ